jgi:hypothetical protein
VIWLEQLGVHALSIEETVVRLQELADAYLSAMDDAVAVVTRLHNAQLEGAPIEELRLELTLAQARVRRVETLLNEFSPPPAMPSRAAPATSTGFRSARPRRCQP